MLEIHKAVVRWRQRGCGSPLVRGVSLIMIPLVCDHGGKIDFTPPQVVGLPARRDALCAGSPGLSLRCLQVRLCGDDFQFAHVGRLPAFGLLDLAVCVAQHHAVVADLAEIGDCKLLSARSV